VGKEVKKIKLVFWFGFVCLVAPFHVLAKDFSVITQQQWQQPLTGLDGQRHILADYREKTIWLDFWASWCGPCRYEFPWLDTMQSRYGKQGFVVLAVSVDEDKQDALRFLESRPVTFATFHDPEGRTAAAFNVKGMPTGILINRKGQIVMHHTGFRKKDAQELEGRIQQALH